jgi:Methyltransferase domain
LAGQPIARRGGAAILAYTKKVLRPLKPVLDPIWKPIRPMIEKPPPAAGEELRAQLQKTRGSKAVLPSDAPIRPITKPEFDDLAAREPYYKARWSYMSVVGALAEDLILRRKLTNALELGAHLRPVIVGADVMALSHRDDLDAEGQEVIHDATVAPWPVEDKAYDLFVALQVFEHLGDKQPQAFAEVRRVARNAILSLPIDWDMPDPNNCHHQISNEKVLSWFAPVKPTRVELGNGGSKKRFVYVFEDLPA